jgi:Xaa-Pro aminopeptidase
MLEKHVPALLVTNIINVQWLTGFTGSFGYALVTQEQAIFITDTRYMLQSQEEVQGFECLWFNRPTTAVDVLREALQRYSIKELYFETSLSYDTWSSFSKQLEDVSLIPEVGLLASLRMIKTPEEIHKIKQACALADECFRHVERMIQPGVCEYDISLDLEFFIRRNHAKLGFEPIVVSGLHSALPHGRPTDKRLEKGDYVTIDLGACLNGYCSDMTRTYLIGEPSSRHQEVYLAVLEAQQAAIGSMKPGVTTKEPDRIAREVLAKHGLSEYFIHGLGHGLGREVHDYGKLSVMSTDVLEAGQVWTVEPGVYIEGFGGVRIEDDVLITESGAEFLTHYPKTLDSMIR